MKKILFLSLFFVLIFSFSLSNKTFAFSGGDGSTTTPYQITTWTELDDIRNHLSSSFILNNDLNTGGDYTGIGDSWNPPALDWSDEFSGNFDGGGHTISDLIIYFPTTDYVGLFGFVTGNISNLGLLNVSITGLKYVGALAGELDNGTISNCFSSGSVTGNSYVGGLVGDLYGTVSNSSSTAIIIGSGSNPDVLGGLVGFLEPSGWGSGTISNSYATGNVSGTGATNVGGLIGYADNGSTVSDSYATGDVSSIGQDYVGAFAGSAYGTISNSYSIGNVSGRNLVGGFIGYLHNSGIISNSYSRGNVSGEDYIGGFIGEIYGSVSNSYSIGSVTGTGDTSIGGFIGAVSSSVSYSYWDTQTSGTTTSAGGTGKTTTEMKIASTFSGWSESIWRLINGAYPTFQWMPSGVTYNLTYTADPVEGGTITGSATQVVASGGWGEPVTASSSLGYHFVDWSDGATSTSRTDTNVTGNISVTANFALDSVINYTLVYNAGVGGSVTGSSTQVITSGGSGTEVTATPNSGYRFLNWDDNNTNPVRTDTNITENKIFNALFQRRSSGGGGIVTTITEEPVVIITSTTTVTTTATTTIPENIFNIQTASSTYSRIVTLNITPNADTRIIVIANNSDFIGSVTIPVQSTYDYNLCYINTTCPSGVYTIYAKSLDIAGIALPVVSTTVTLNVRPIIEEIIDVVVPPIIPEEPETVIVVPPAVIIDGPTDNNITPPTGNGGTNVKEEVATSSLISKGVEIIVNIKDEVKKIVTSPAGSVSTKTFAAVGVVAGTTATISTLAFATPITFSEVWFLPTRLFGLILGWLGVRRKSRPWGTVYDSVTKRPIDPAYLSLINQEDGKEVATAITDIDGRYGFSAPKGRYKIIARKTNYLFPSVKISGLDFDEVYSNLYFNEEIIVSNDGDIITKDIPMDSQAFDWNEFAKNKQGLNVFIKSKDIFWAKFSKVIFWLGFAVAFLALLLAPAPYNYGIFALYIVLYILNFFGFGSKKSGVLKDIRSNLPLSFAIVKIFREGSDIEMIKKVADINGKYYCLIPNGSYYIKIEKKNIDGKYTLVHQSDLFDVERGIINMNIEV